MHTMLQHSNPKNTTSRDVKLKDVAAAAGVSVTTASRALSDPKKVQADTLTRIMAAVRQLGYLPNSAARALRSRRTRLIGAVLPTLNYAIYSLQIKALQNTLNQHGYSLVVTASGYSSLEEMHQARTLIERGVEGLVLIGSAHHPDLNTLLENQEIPSVDTYVYGAHSRGPCVGFNNAKVSAKAIGYLIDLGHRHIAMVAGVTRDNDRAGGRVQGVKAELAAHGLSLPPQHLIEKPYTIAAGREALRALLTTQPRPTAVFCASDVLAFGVLIECSHQGIDVPKHLSVIGFDNLEFCAHLPPGMTTINVPAEAMGEGAARYLIAKLSGSAVEPQVELEANLIIRGTTAPPANQTSAVPLLNADDGSSV
ncbi:MAG TPA: LacI family DNA-binding transcriptional regulator [Castellaniella sp.]|uniref:LacI family DNA-binding transcriptional regulator n=1 Tax=Castellaniella sp. TaxID=1955812 RepID=UPI002EE1308F